MPYRYPRAKRVFARLLELAFSPWAALAGRRGEGGEEPRQILLIEPFQMGDVLSLSVMLSPLKARFPHAQITLLTQPKNRAVYDGDSRISATVALPFPWAQYEHKAGKLADWITLLKGLWQLRRAHFDLGIDTRGEVRSQIAMLIAGCRERLGYTSYMGSNMRIRGTLLTQNLGLLPPGHRYRRNYEIAARIVGHELSPLRFPTFESAAIPPDRAVPDRRQVVVHTAGGWIFKRWSESSWRAVVENLATLPQTEVILVGSAGEREDLENLSRQIEAPHRVRITSFTELVALIKGSDLFIGLDSGPMNLAVTLNIPVIALFGPGDSEAWQPLGPRDVTLHAREDYPCNPCFQTRCVVPERSCMTAITPAAVISAATKILAELPDVRTEFRAAAGVSRPANS